MTFIQHQQNVLQLIEIFNQEHAALIIQQKLGQQPNFDTVHLHNVGVKIAKDAFDKFCEHPIFKVKLYYNWNQIMMMPKLVCYDKNTWKTLQQLANWNRQWSLIFRQCYSLQEIEADITCSYADGQFVKAFLQGLSALPNVKKVILKISTKNENTNQVLQAFKKAKIFPEFHYKFTKYS